MTNRFEDCVVGPDHSGRVLVAAIQRPREVDLTGEERSRCPDCGEPRRVFVNESDEIVAVLPSEGDIDWAKR